MERRLLFSKNFPREFKEEEQKQVYPRVGAAVRGMSLLPSLGAVSLLRELHNLHSPGRNVGSYLLPKPVYRQQPAHANSRSFRSFFLPKLIPLIVHAHVQKPCTLNPTQSPAYVRSRTIQHCVLPVNGPYVTHQLASTWCTESNGFRPAEGTCIVL